MAVEEVEAADGIWERRALGVGGRAGADVPAATVGEAGGSAC